MAQSAEAEEAIPYESHTEIRKVEGVLATTLSCATISLMDATPQGKHRVLRRN